MRARLLLAPVTSSGKPSQPPPQHRLALLPGRMLSSVSSLYALAHGARGE